MYDCILFPISSARNLSKKPDNDKNKNQKSDHQSDTVLE